MKTYDKYKSSGIEWIGDIPEHWKAKRLKFVANVQSSNVDKKSFPGETSIFLCNYVDVYKNDFIDASISFMEATATEKEIEKFILNEGDVLITKDSETPDDIANPAFVTRDFENVICGYHLAQIKSDKKELSGKYLFRLFQSKRFNSYFEVSANGITRFGLPLDSITGVFVSLPSLGEQNTIAEYLDEKTAQVDKLITNKLRLIELLREERKAIINQAVIRGINPNAKLKPSGIDWLGDIPEHWEVVPMTKYLESIIDYRGKTPTKSESGVFLVTARNIKKGEINYSLSQEYILEEEYEKTMSRGELEIGDVLFTTEAPLGEAANVDRTDVAVAQRIIKFRGKKGVVNNYFLKHWILSPMFQQDLYTFSTGSTAVGIKGSKLFNLRLMLPPIEEQKQILDYISQQSEAFDATIATIEKEIGFMREYCTALISEVVTGKIRVTN